MSDITIRKLQKEDLEKGFLQTLDSLRQASNIDKKTAERIFDKINSNPDQIIAIAIKEGKVVGSTTLIIETKLINNGGKKDQIEEEEKDKKSMSSLVGI